MFPTTLTEHFARLAASVNSAAKSLRSLRHAIPPKSSWGRRRLQRFKQVGSRRMQLHATRGWKYL